MLIAKWPDAPKYNVIDCNDQRAKTIMALLHGNCFRITVPLLVESAGAGIWYGMTLIWRHLMSFLENSQHGVFWFTEGTHFRRLIDGYVTVWHIFPILLPSGPVVSQPFSNEPLTIKK